MSSNLGIFRTKKRWATQQKLSKHEVNISIKKIWKIFKLTHEDHWREAFTLGALLKLDLQRGHLVFWRSISLKHKLEHHTNQNLTNHHTSHEIIFNQCDCSTLPDWLPANNKTVKLLYLVTPLFNCLF